MHSRVLYASTYGWKIPRVRCCNLYFTTNLLTQFKGKPSFIFSYTYSSDVPSDSRFYPSQPSLAQGVFVALSEPRSTWDEISVYIILTWFIFFHFWRTVSLVSMLKDTFHSANLRRSLLVIYSLSLFSFWRFHFCCGSLGVHGCARLCVKTSWVCLVSLFTNSETFCLFSLQLVSAPSPVSSETLAFRPLGVGMSGKFLFNFILFPCTYLQI